MSIGRVKWFSDAKGYGFIETEEGRDVFVHYSAIEAGGYRTLEEGARVSFLVKKGPKGLQDAFHGEPYRERMYWTRLRTWSASLALMTLCSSSVPSSSLTFLPLVKCLISSCSAIVAIAIR